MLSKKDKQPPTPVQPQATSTPVPPPAEPRVNTAMNNNSSNNTSATSPTAVTAVIGPKIRFKGELIGEEDLLVQGQIDGTINLKDHNLVVGQQGVVKANVIAKTVTIEGNVEGDLFGQEKITIKASSNVNGNITADRVSLEDGAKFRGSIDMDVDASKDPTKSNPLDKPSFNKPLEKDKTTTPA